MDHLFIILSIITTCIGLGLVIFFLQLYIYLNSQIIKNYAVFILLCTLNVAIESFRNITTVIDKNIIINIIYYAAYTLWISVFIYAGNSILHNFLCIPFTKIKKIASILLAVTNSASLAVVLIKSNSIANADSMLKNSQIHFNDPMLFMFTIYIIALIIKHYKNINTGHIQRYFEVILILTILFIPGFVFDLLRDKYNIILISAYMYFVDLYIFSLGIMNIVLVNKYFFHLAVNSSKKITVSNLPARFIHDYRISQREKDILFFLMQHNTYSQISSKLFISQKTVEKALSFIYAKTKTANKTMLLNLIKSYEN
jgi:DNA-binding CsgD family transcriptional regulator